ncbi:hypothetical protein BCR33DRAFT_715971 [Rhizoclosmatium globosum]|uniref:Uncharacterized protein n=1 Tax=Rhizoclosmatium globosum TaxID=329046 RepID=A0A1Y2CI05_9FUNG|nr:hypothetical protein BCR33DRAFT_715971 [Rhizoclosmatium globosum]|eukprot:ORY45945.1 hypothetical protein BCR33DRAFT_715971 [Rhizoclosmatium globosum]
MRQVRERQQRRHFVCGWIESELLRSSDASFASQMGLSRVAFYSLCVLMSLSGSSDSSASSSSSFVVGPDTSLALLLVSLAPATQASIPASRKAALKAALTDPLRTRVLRAAATAINENVYLASLPHDNDNDSDNDIDSDNNAPPESLLLIDAIKLKLGKNVANLHSQLPRESAITADVTVAELLQLDPASIPARLKKSCAAEPSSYYALKPSFSSHPVFQEKALVGMHRINKEAALRDENDILKYFIDGPLKYRFKVVHGLNINVYRFNDDTWRSKFGIGRFVFAWFWANLVQKLTPTLDEVNGILYYTAETKILVFLTFLAHDPPTRRRDVLDQLLLEEFNNSMTRDELSAVILQVRHAIGTEIFGTKKKHDVNALAFTAVFGKFPYIYDTIAHRLGTPFELPALGALPAARQQPQVPTVAETAIQTDPPEPPSPATNPASNSKSTRGRRGRKRTNTGGSSLPSDATIKASAQDEIPTDPIAAMALKNPFAVSAVRRASGPVVGVTGSKRPASSSPPSAIKDIRAWRELLVSDGEEVTLDGCEPIVIGGGGGVGNTVGGDGEGKRKRVVESDVEEDEVDEIGEDDEDRENDYRDQEEEGDEDDMEW